MRTIAATFTESEVCTLRDAIAGETVRMRQHVRRMNEAIAHDEPATVTEDNTIGAKRLLRELESLLAWSTEAAARA